ncbi:MAG: alpha/beta fold hydrolase [Lactimicrobium massiliense]
MKDNRQRTKHSFLKILLAIVLVITAVAGVSFGIYVSDYYHADETALSLLENPGDVSILQDDKGNYTVLPQKAGDTGIIFYPGGKVDERAYLPLLKMYAEQGITCVLLKMPFHLAVLDINGADGIQKQYPGITKWYLAGHSLGGAMATAYIARHVSEYQGLILLGAYSTKDLSDTDLTVVWIDGDQDDVINQKQVLKNQDHYPENTYVFTIAGGNHAQFGSYGVQKGDGHASISAKEQWQETVDDTLAVIS